MPIFLNKLGENKIAIRQITIEILKNCFQKKLIKTSHLNKELLQLLKSKNSHHREESLNLITFMVEKKLIKNPKMYLESWFADIAPLIDDKKMKVKIAALECLGKIVKNNNSKDIYKKLQKFMTPGGCEMIR